MTFRTGELIKCQNPECGAEFRKNPFSTIQHKFCYRCQKLKDFERNSKNKKLLARSSFVKHKEGSGFKTNKYVTRNTEDVTEAKIKPKKNKTKAGDKKNARNLADGYFSKYIRLLHSFESGGKRYCKCYTCNKVIRIKHEPGKKNGAENGHWQRRGYYATRYHENDCRPQCFQCNYWQQGKPEVFEQNLIRDIGQEEVENIKQLALSDKGDDSIIFLNEQIEKYKGLFNALMKELGYKKWGEL